MIDNIDALVRELLLVIFFEFFFFPNFSINELIFFSQRELVEELQGIQFLHSVNLFLSLKILIQNNFAFP